MADLLSRLRSAAKSDDRTVWFNVVTPEQVEFVESLLAFRLPPILKQAYLQISNGGFGPGRLIGLPGGYHSSWGDLIQTWQVMQQVEDYEEGWLPIIDRGCADFSIVDCESDFEMVTFCGQEFHPEEYAFDEMLERWLDGELPDLSSGEFRPTKH